MRFMCLKCGIVWGKGDPEIGEWFSHGLCMDHLREKLIPIYRKRQRQEGHFDCFGTAGSYCDQELCCYRPICLKEETT